MKRKSRERRVDWLSVVLTVTIGALIAALLWLIKLNMPEKLEESGVPVMLGNMGNLDTDYEFTEIESVSPSVVPVPTAPVKVEPLVTQNLEETVGMDDGEMNVDEPKKTPQPTPEELRAQQEQRVSEEANQLMRNLFGKGRVTASESNADAASAEGAPGSTEGNSPQGKTSGTGGFGTFDLGGRDVDGNGLQRPAIKQIPEEGRVVVTITVNPAGEVVSTSINKRTNTTNYQLRAAAEEAARRTRFNAVSGPDNQTGTITYYFRFK